MPPARVGPGNPPTTHVVVRRGRLGVQTPVDRPHDRVTRLYPTP